MKLAICVVHAKHRPERREPFERLMAKLDAVRHHGLKVIDERAPAHVWSEHAWTWLAQQDQATHGLLLQDDVVLCPDFGPTLERAIAACPRHIIALNHCRTPLQAKQADAAGWRWVTTVDGLVGHGYVMPRAAYGALLDWRAQELLPGQAEALGEDTLIDLWCMDRKLLVWHPVPAIVDHPANESTWGNPHDPGSLQAAVPPRAGMAELEWASDAVHAGRVVRGTHGLLIESLPPSRARLERYFEIEGNRA